MAVSLARPKSRNGATLPFSRPWAAVRTYRFRRANVLLTIGGQRSHVTITRRYSGLDRYYHFITDFAWPIYTWSSRQAGDAFPVLTDVVSLGRQPLRFAGLFNEIFDVPLRADALHYRTLSAPFRKDAERVSCCNTLRRCYLEGFDGLDAARDDLQRFNTYLDMRFPVAEPTRPIVTLIEREAGEADRGATRRTVTNHKAVAETIQAYCSRHDLEFQNVQLEGLPFAEQFRLFKQSRIVIGQHGGGLANALWLRPGAASLIELAQAATRDHFLNLCEDFGLGYGRVTCPLADATAASPERLTVDPDAVLAQLDTQLSSAR